MSFFIHVSFRFVSFLFHLLRWDCYNATYCPSKCTTPSRVRKGQSYLWPQWQRCEEIYKYGMCGPTEERDQCKYECSILAIQRICQLNCICLTFLPYIIVCSLSVHWVTPQSVSLLHAPSLLIVSCFFFDWHAILKRCLHHRAALDWTRLLDPTLSHVRRKTASSVLLYL